MIRIADAHISCFADLNKVSTANLLAYYNSVTGRNTRQFLKRAKGMQQVWALIEPQLAQVEEAYREEPAEIAPERAERVQAPATPATVGATLATAPSTAEKPAEGAATAQGKAQPAGLKARVDELLAALASGPRTVAELAEMLGMDQKKSRSTIDTARRVGHSIACVGRGTFALADEAK